MKQIYSISPRISVLCSVLMGLRSRLVSAIVLLGLLLPTSLLHADVDYFYFEALEASAQIYITRQGSPTQNFVFQYSIDNGLTWTNCTVNSGTSGVTVCNLANIGDKVLIRGKNNTSKGIGNHNNSGTYGAFKFVITSKQVSVGGNIMTLIDYEDDVIINCQNDYNGSLVLVKFSERMEEEK